jgi:hypothetical protein
MQVASSPTRVEQCVCVLSHCQPLHKRMYAAVCICISMLADIHK